MGVTDEGGDDDGGGQDVKRHERELGGGVVGPGDRRHAGQRGERHGRLEEAATGRAATPVVTAAATRPATTVVRRSDLAERVVAYRGAVIVGAVVVRDMAFSLGSAAPGSLLTTSTNTTARIDTRPGRNISARPVETAGPVRSWYRNPAEDRGRRMMRRWRNG